MMYNTSNKNDDEFKILDANVEKYPDYVLK